MSLDPYQLCPCGSGKKLKFCCHAIVADMEKVARLRDSRQQRMALQLLENLAKSHPENVWVQTDRASVLLAEERFDEAKEILGPFVEQDSASPLAIGLHGMASLATEPYETAKYSIQRAIQRCGNAYPDLVSSMAMGVAAQMYEQKCFLAARQHLTISMLYAPEEIQEDTFLRLLKFDSDSHIPYPMRGVHSLARYEGDEQATKEAAKAERLASIGRLTAAAEKYAKLVEQNPESAELWHNVGLCRAWDGDIQRAAEAFHQAARLHTNRESAIECETLAQLLDLSRSPDTVAIVNRGFKIQSMSRFLTKLKQHDQFVPGNFSPEQLGLDESELLPSELFQILDRPVPSEPETESLSLDTVPHVWGQLLLYDADPEHDRSQSGYLAGRTYDLDEKVVSLLNEIAGDEIEWDESASSTVVIDELPRELDPLHWRWYFHSKVPIGLRRNLEQAKWRSVIQETWMHTPQAGLNGKTPAEMTGDADTEIALTASLFVLDSYCNQNNYMLDVDEMIELLKVQPIKQVDVDDQTSFNSFSVMQMDRLPIAQLTDKQLTYTLNRALLIHHLGLLYRVLKEVVSRPKCLEEVDVQRVYATLSDLCRDQNQTEEALEWVAKGGEWASQQGDKSFQLTLQWELRELSLLVENPRDPRLPPLMNRLWDYYGRKLPQLKPRLSELAHHYGIPLPADGEGHVDSPGGIWTPEKEAGSEEGKKLWVPGQD